MEGQCYKLQTNRHRHILLQKLIFQPVLKIIDLRIALTNSNCLAFLFPRQKCTDQEVILVSVQSVDKVNCENKVVFAIC